MRETDFGKYKLIAELGHGGMADVFLAVQGGFSGSGFRKLTVVKRLRKNLAAEPEFVAMLVDEARIAARLNHPNCVQTNEVGEFEGQYFIAMEYLDGQSLHGIQHRNEKLAKEGTATSFGPDLQYIVLLDVLAGLHHAHELLDYDGKPLEIVHRDVTPHNIFVTYDGQVKVVDFGIAKAARRASETAQGILKGKVRYMAPEQTLGKGVDRRADLFAAGIMLWEVATGQRLWRDKDDLEVVQLLVAGDISRSPRSVKPDVPEALDAICVKAMAQKPADRYATAEDMRNDLEQFLIDSGTLATARRKMPAALDSLFKDKRKEIREIIDRQLQALADMPEGDFAAVAMPGSSPSLSTPRFDTMQSEGQVEAHAEDELEAAPPPSRASLAAFGAAVLVAILLVMGAVVIGLRGKSEAAVTVPTSAPAPVEINIRINASPSTAMVSVDDGPLGPVPYGQTVKKDGRQHRIHVEAPGYQPKNDLAIFSQDMVLSFDLVKETAQPVVATPASVATTDPAAPMALRGKKAHTSPAEGTAAPPPTTTGPAVGPQPTAPTPAVTTAAVPTVVAPPVVTAPPVDVAADYRKAVNRAVRGHTAEVQACYDRARVSSPQLAGAVTIGASLTPSGSVSAAHVANSTARGQAGPGATMLEQCLVDRFRSWTFPAVPPGASSDVSYTFKFE